MQAVLIYHIFLRRITMPHLEELVKDVIEKRIAANAAHEAEITQLTKVIAGEQKEIENDYAIQTRPRVSSARWLQRSTSPTRRSRTAK